MSSQGCDPDGVQKMAVKVTLASTVPPDADLPSYVVDPIPGAELGTMVHKLLLFAPAGGRIDAATADGDDIDLLRSQLGERPVGVALVQLTPGETTQLEYVVFSGKDQRGEIPLASTPLADGTGGEVVTFEGCES